MGGVVMVEKHEIVEVGNANRDQNGTVSLPEARPGARSSKFAAWLRALFRSRQNRAISVNCSTRIERMMQRRGEFVTDVEFEIDASRDHWSEVWLTSTEMPSGQGAEAAPQTNAEIVESLRRQWPNSGKFFAHFDDDWSVGAKIAEGGQAEIFEAWQKGNDYVLKVFNEGALVRDLQRQWPPAILQPTQELGRYWAGGDGSPVLHGTVVMNGRFAFVMIRCWGDLRKLIDLSMQRNNNQRPPFSDAELERNMLNIARCVKSLHKDNIIHRDLKAANVLIGPDRQEIWDYEAIINIVFPSDWYTCLVADYECSIGVVGTGFWRAPEILRGVRDCKITPDLFTRASDVYSFAMTCYEMITGQLPFEGVRFTNYEVVLKGKRPILPKHTRSWMKSLLDRCWDPIPSKRPNFEEIVENITRHMEQK